MSETPLDRDLAIEIMASWALEGMEPAPETLSDIRKLVEGTLTLEEFRQRTQEIVQRER